MLGKKVMVLVNLKPAKLAGVLSEGMLLCAENDKGELALVTPDKDINEFFIMGERYKTGIFSHNTALYFYHLTDRTPMSLDMTFPSNVRVNNDFLEPHYIKPELHSLGETTLKLEDGTNIKIYDLERTICDIIRDRNKIDPQIFNTAMKEYFKSNKRNLNLLYKYAKKLKIDKILKKYMEVLD